MGYCTSIPSIGNKTHFISFLPYLPKTEFFTKTVDLYGHHRSDTVDKSLKLLVEDAAVGKFPEPVFTLCGAFFPLTTKGSC